MNKEFIPYDQALALKELEFDKPCFGYWKTSDWLIEEKTRTDGYTHADQLCSAPTYSQAFRWFREKHNLHSNISSWRSDDNLSFYHEFEIYSLTSSHSAGDEYSTYEEAELACLRNLIEIVKGGNK